jgi:hypothetical protein
MCQNTEELTNHGMQYLPILSARLPSRMAPTRKPNIRADMVALAIQFLENQTQVFIDMVALAIQFL